MKASTLLWNGDELFRGFPGSVFWKAPSLNAGTGCTAILGFITLFVSSASICCCIFYLVLHLQAHRLQTQISKKLNLVAHVCFSCRKMSLSRCAAAGRARSRTHEAQTVFNLIIKLNVQNCCEPKTRSTAERRGCNKEANNTET